MSNFIEAWQLLAASQSNQRQTSFPVTVTWQLEDPEAFAVAMPSHPFTCPSCGERSRRKSKPCSKCSRIAITPCMNPKNHQVCPPQSKSKGEPTPQRGHNLLDHRKDQTGSSWRLHNKRYLSEDASNVLPPSASMKHVKISKNVDLTYVLPHQLRHENTVQGFHQGRVSAAAQAAIQASSHKRHQGEKAQKPRFV